jgi:hypothetical protein
MSVGGRKLRAGAAFWLAAALSACAPIQPFPPGHAACYQRMEGHVAELMPGFAALGYQPSIRLFIDEKLPDVYGLHAMSDVLGDALPSGRIRVRASSVCANDRLAQAVVAHEMAHVALKHRGAPTTGVVLTWEGLPPQEREADTLALAVLRRINGYPQAQRFLECHLNGCGGAAGPKGTPAFRGPPLKGSPAAP